MTADDVRKMLRKACDAAGSQKAWAEQAGVTPQYVQDVLSARREPAERICAALGVERVTTYRRVRRNSEEGGA